MNSHPFHCSVYEPEEVFIYNRLFEDKMKYFDSLWISKELDLSALVLDFINHEKAEILMEHIEKNIYVIQTSSGTACMQLRKSYGIISIWSSSRTIIDDLKSFIGKDNLKDPAKSLTIHLYYMFKGDVDYRPMLCDDDYINSMLDFELFKLAGVDVELLAKSFFTSNDTILLLYGQPGMGKSKLSLSLAYYAKNKLSIPTSLSLIKSKDVIRKLTQRADMFFSYSRMNSTIFVFDDIDFMTLKRGTDEETDNFVNFLLSITDGVVPQYNKFIITTNRELKDVDKALFRPGRLFAALELQKIEYYDLKQYDERLADECRASYNKNDFTLAEVNHIRLMLMKKKKVLDFTTKPRVMKSWKELMENNVGFKVD